MKDQTIKTAKNEKKKVLQAKVISDKMEKSITVITVKRVKAEKYGKYINRKTKIMAHDENKIAKVGDVVLIEEGRPISKNKSWVLTKVLT